MIKLFSLTVLRNILKNKLHSFLSIFGLALGFAAFMYIITYVYYETNFDSFHTKADRTYRCIAYAKLGDTEEYLPRSEVPLAGVLKNEIPEVETATRLFVRRNILARYKENKFIEKEIWYADANVFDVFDFKLMEGDKTTSLSSPFSMLLTHTTAKKYFGTESPVGKSINLANDKVYKITGVLADIPGNSNLKFDFLASSLSLSDIKNMDWGAFDNTYTYVVAKKGIDPKVFERKYETSLRKYEEFVIKQFVTPSMEEFEKKGNYFYHKLQPLNDIHLNSSFAEETSTYGNKRFLIILGITGILILIIACANFINLNTATASKRAKEIGIKKVSGSTRRSITCQVLFETFVYALLALFLAIVILIVILPLLNNFSKVTMEFHYFLNRTVLLSVFLLPFVVGILAGMYPAFFINRFNPVQVLKGGNNSNKQKAWLRGSLVSLQFLIFIVLIFSTVIINKQINYLRDQNPGFNKENTLVVKNMYHLGNQANSFKNELLDNSSVVSASFSSAIPSMDDYAGNPFNEKGKNEKFFMNRMLVDADFQKTLKIEVTDGRFFSDNFNSEKNNAVINEQAAHVLGWNNCQDKILHDINNSGKNFRVIGIVKDFHMKSLRESARPLVLRITNNSQYLSIRIQKGNLRQVLDQVKDKWERFNDNAPFEYFFLDQSFDAQYKSEEQLSKIIASFTLIAIIIASLGLFGLVSYIATQRTKEIGIRKVNGARISEVLVMLNKDFAKWVAIAFVIATPIAYCAMNKWLENFAYKTELSWWIFALAGLLALGIALLTVSFQSWKAATRNPVESLRYE